MILCHTAKEVKKFTEFSKNALKRVGYQLSFPNNWQKLRFEGSFLWTFSVALVTAITSQSALK